MIGILIGIVSILGLALFVREWAKWNSTTGRDLDMRIAHYGSLSMMSNEELEEWQKRG